MKIESLKSLNYQAGTAGLIATIIAETAQQVIDELVGKDELIVYTDNTGEDIPVETLTGYKFLYSIEEKSPGCFKVVLNKTEITLDELKATKIAEILKYDSSPEVNSFYLAGQRMWLDRETRISIKNTMLAEKELGLDTTIIWFEGVSFELPIDPTIIILNRLEVEYAKACYNWTQKCISDVRLMESNQEVLDFEYKSGYPAIPNY